MTLMVEEPLFAPAPAAVPAQRSIRANHPVAWHDDRDRVLTVDHADRAHRRWRSDLTRHVGVRTRGAVGDVAERPPRAPLEVRATLFERNLEPAARSVEIFAQLRPRLLKDRMIAWDDRAAEF